MIIEGEIDKSSKVSFCTLQITLTRCAENGEKVKNSNLNQITALENYY